MQLLYSCCNPHVSASAAVFPGITFDVLFPYLLTCLLIGFLLLLLKYNCVLTLQCVEHSVSNLNMFFKVCSQICTFVDNSDVPLIWWREKKVSTPLKNIGKNGHNIFCGYFKKVGKIKQI